MINTQRSAVALLVLDLDGTVRQGKDDALGRFVNGPEDVVVFPEALIMMRRWKNRGGRIIGVTNQGGIALGLVTVERVIEALVETQTQCDGMFDKICYCKHHPDAKEPEMAQCWCRKPLPGMVIEGAYGLAQEHDGEHYPPYMGLMVGDRWEDQDCARVASLKFQWAADWRAQAKEPAA